MVELFDISLLEHMVGRFVKRSVANTVEKTGLKGENDTSSVESHWVHQTDQQI